MLSGESGKRRQVDWRQGRPIFAVLAVLFTFSVVVGLVVILIAPREPNLDTSVQCLSNLRVLTVAMRAYAADNSDRLPRGAGLYSSRYGPVGQPEEGLGTGTPWPRGDWRGCLLPFVESDETFYCPVTLSPFSYQMNAGANGLDIRRVTDPDSFALVWDAGLKDRPQGGPHAGKYAVHTLGGTSLMTDGEDSLFERLTFAP